MVSSVILCKEGSPQEGPIALDLHGQGLRPVQGFVVKTAHSVICDVFVITRLFLDDSVLSDGADKLRAGDSPWGSAFENWIILSAFVEDLTGG